MLSCSCNLEKIGLVSKEDGARDARVSLVCLSEAGLGVFQDAMKSFDQRARTFVESINVKQRQALNEMSQVRL